ncbi:MAG: ABC transporter transmembrane domain-containing protein [Alphaproteobacteria bacterium]
MADDMEPRLFRYIWRHSRREQTVILVMVLAALPVYFASLNLPRMIVNGPIAGEGFGDGDPAQLFGRIVLPIGPDGWVLFEGLPLDRGGMLIALSLVFLGLVLVNGLFKFAINTFKGLLGERLLRRLRYELVDRVLRFPTPHFRRVRASEIATMVKDEVEPLGGFIGDAFVLPLYQAGLAMTALIFIMVQSVFLGLLALAVVLLQAFLIPWLRQPILDLGRQRQLAARNLAGRVAEIVDGIHELRTHDTTNYARADISERLGKIFWIRAALYQRKFMIKFLNNFLSQLTPFLFYLVGGLLVIRGQMDIGQLVAVIAAYKDLPAPIKELINWDHQRNDVQIKYEQVVDHFNPDGLVPSERQSLEDHTIERLDGEIRLQNVSVIDDSGARYLEGISFAMPPGRRVAVVGPIGGGKEYLAPLLVRIMAPTEGEITIGSEDLQDLPDHVVGRRLAYAGAETFLFPSSVRDNLIHVLRNRPVVLDLPRDPGDRRLRERHRREADAAGNASFGLEADWIDYNAIGADGPKDLDLRLIEAAEIVSLREDFYEFGLRGSADPASFPGIDDRLLKARRRIAERLKAETQGKVIELFEPGKFNRNATIGENILFGTPRSRDFAPGAVAAHPYVQRVLKDVELTDDLLAMGVEIASTMVEMFADLPPDHEFFDQFSFISSRNLPEFQALTNRLNRNGIETASADERARLKALPFMYIESRHRLKLITPEVEAKVLAARAAFAAGLSPDLEGTVDFFDPDRYSPGASVLDNVLLGRIAYGQAGAQGTVRRIVSEVLEEFDLTLIVLCLGLDFEVGAGGRRLTAAQRQKLAIARALIKRPDLLIVDLALAGLDAPTQNRILSRVLAFPHLAGVMWVLNRPELAANFDHVLVVEDGHIVEQGRFDGLANGSGTLSRMLKS